MHQKNEVAEVFNGFEKRMKFINIVRTITEYKYADHIRAIFGVEKDRLTNMILAVMVYIKERTLSEDLDCKLSDVQRFLEDTAPVFANNTFYDAEVIAKYIIVDILQHGGEISTFQTFHSQTMSFEMIPVRLIDEEHGNYTLTDDAFDFLFRIKDIDSTLDYSVTRFKMQEYMKRDNYSEALSQSRELVSRIRNIKTGINNFILRCRENISKVSVDEYESLITRIRSLLEDEYKELIEIQKNAKERAAKLSDAASAGVIFEEAKKDGIEAFHLTTGMCPAHRKQVLATIRRMLDDREPILCVSTQLIEAGVDVSFRSVVRMLAGLDSIAQAAGRCNRHGGPEIGNVFVVNQVEENLDHLKDIAVGKEKSNRVLDDYKDNPSKYDGDIIGPKMIEWYYQNYFYDRKDIMDYPVTANGNDSLLNMLSINSNAVANYRRAKKSMPAIDLRQSFMTAAKLFKSIDAPTQSVIVRYGEEGRDLVNQLCSVFEVEKQYALIKKAQQYAVNLFPHEFERLAEQDALYRVQKETEIFYLDCPYYSKITGVSLEPVRKEEQFKDEYIDT